MNKIFISVFLILFYCSAQAQKTALVYQSGHQSPVIMSSISASGKLFLSVEKEEVAILWNIKSGKQIGTFKDIIAASFTADNTILLLDNKYNLLEMDIDGTTISSHNLTEFGDDKNNRSEMLFIPEARMFIVNSHVYTQKGYTGRLQVEDLAGRPADYSQKSGKYIMCWEQFIYLFDKPGDAPVKTFSNVMGDSRLNTAYFLPDGENVIAFSNDGVAILNTVSGEVKNNVNVANSPVAGLRIVQDTYQIKTDFGYRQLNTRKAGYVLNNYSREEIATNISGLNKQILLSKKDNPNFLALKGASEDWLTVQYLQQRSGLYVSSHKNHFLLWDLDAGYLKNVTPSMPAILPFQQSKRVITYKDDLSLLDSTGKKIRTYERSQRINRTISVKASFDEKYIAHTYDYQFNGPRMADPHAILEIFEVNSGKRILTKDEVSTAAFSNKKNVIATGYEYGSNSPISFYEIPSGKLLSQVSIDGGTPFVSNLLFSPDDRHLYLTTSNGKFQIETATGNISKLNELAPINLSAHTVSENNELYVAGSYAGDIHFYNIQNNTYLPQKTIRASTQPVYGVSITPDGKYIFSNSNENFIKLWSFETGELLATLYPNNETGDWAVITPDGRFDASVGAQESMFYVKGTETYPLSTLSEIFYTPRLLPRLLHNERFEKIEVDIQTVKPKPRTKILYAQRSRNVESEENIPSYSNNTGIAEITVNATAPEDKVDEIRLFHNGKAVNLATRGLFVTDDDGTDTKKYTINLLPGINTFRAIALNSQRTESEPDEIMVNYKKDGVSPTPPVANEEDNKTKVDEIDRNATLHIVVVGINGYKGKINPLTYALPDATAFKEELERDAKSMINNVKSYLITDDAASKAGIVAAFDNIKKSAKPQDVFVFYYAGHGYIHPSNKEFYLVSSDVADGGESLLKNGVSAKELQTFAVDIPAQKQLFIMDACQSAGAFEKMLQHDGEQQKALAVVSRSTGTHWMAASGSTETAKEFGELGHGVFTYSLLEALKGKAVNNKMITVNGLKNYLQTIVPELVKKYGGNSQYPASYGFGNDFPVEVIK